MNDNPGLVPLILRGYNVPDTLERARKELNMTLPCDYIKIIKDDYLTAEQKIECENNSLDLKKMKRKQNKFPLNQMIKNALKQIVLPEIN